MPIREAFAEDAAIIARLVREANRDVAVRFGLTAENCPKHTSLCTEDWVRAEFARGERYFVCTDGATVVGCVAYENPQPGLAYLNRLSVLPAQRRRGNGARLVGHIVDLARAESVATISIGVIGEHAELQRWYRKLGFVDGETRRFAHLPFSVRYMTYAVAGEQAAEPTAGR